MEDKISVKDYEEKHRTLFEVELKKIKFFYDERVQLSRFVEHSIEALYYLYLMWYTHEGVSPELFAGMTKRSVWFFLHGVFIQRFMDQGWQPELASTVTVPIIEYIVSQAYDLFGVRTGIIKVN